MIVLAAGTGYLVLIAWLLSWWIVPGYREHGPGLLSLPVWYGGTGLFAVRALSGPLGSLITALGAALSGGVSGLRLAVPAVGGVILIAWLAFFSVTSHYPVFFGIGGGLILLCFLASCFRWARNRDTLPEPIKASADLRILGYVFLFSAAWGLCGLLGAPTYALRPDIAQQFRSLSSVPSIAVTVLVCLVVGWVCFALAERKLYQSPR